MKYGPYSDGEADSLKKGDSPLPARPSPCPGAPRRGARGVRGRGLLAPHYATMSRAASSQQSSFDSSTNGASIQRPAIKYTSQPQLHRVEDSGPSTQPYLPARPDALTPLSLKTSITFPRQKPLLRPADKSTRPNQGRLPRQEQAVRQELVMVAPTPQPGPARGARHPPAPPTRAPTTRHSFHLRQNSSDDNPFEYEHSRSSSVGDIHWGLAGLDTRMATPDGQAALPYDSSLPYRRLAMNGAPGRRAARSGAVRVDLSFADKTIRRPGSAPDLVTNHDSGFTGSGKEEKKSRALASRGRSVSSEREGRRAGVSPATRKVAFAGIETDDDSDTETEGPARAWEEVWVKQGEGPRAEEGLTLGLAAGSRAAGTLLDYN